MMLDRKINYFMDVVKEGSFSAAAKKRYLSQSALSQQIAALEEELSVVLFDRSGYRPILTEEGKLFYQGCLSISEQCENLLQAVREASHKTVRVGFTGSFENRELLQVVNQFKKKEPSVEISFVKGDFGETLKNLLDNKVDISFGIDSEFKYNKEISYDILFPYEMCVICSHSHALAKLPSIDIDMLKNQEFISLSKKNGKGFYKDFYNAFRLDGFKPKIKKEVDSFDELVFSVSIGEGISIVSTNVVRENEVKIIPLLHTHHKSNYAVSYRKDTSNPVVIRLIEAAKEYFQNTIS